MCVVLFDGHIYGCSDGIGWICQNWLTGDEVWSSKALEKGTETIADGMMFCLTEDSGRTLKRPATRNWKRSNEVTRRRASDRFRMRIGSFRMFTVECDH